MKTSAILSQIVPAGFTHGITALGALLLQWLLAKHLAIADVGLFFALITILMTCDLVVRFGIEQTILREGGHFFLSGDKRGFLNVLWNARRFVLKRAMFAAGLIVLASYQIDSLFLSGRENYFAILAVAIAIPFYGLTIPWAASLRCRGLTAIAPLWGPGGAAALTALLLGMLATQVALNLTMAVAVYAVVVLALAIPFLLVRVEIHNKTELPHASDYGITQISQFLVQWGTLLVVAGVGLPEDVALLNVTLRVAATINFVLLIFNGVLAPRYANFYKDGHVEELKKLARNATWIMALVASGPFTIIIMFGDQILELFGPQYNEALILLYVVATAQFLNVLAGPVLNLLNMTGHQKDVKKITVVSGVCVIGFSVPAFSSFNLVGIVCVIAGGIILNNILAIMAVRKRLGFVPIL